jgi:hypothetical protein
MFQFRMDGLRDAGRLPRFQAVPEPVLVRFSAHQHGIVPLHAFEEIVLKLPVRIKKNRFVATPFRSAMNKSSVVAT